MIKAQISVSLDGFVAGPDQSEENPLGIGGEELHDWVVKTESWRRQHGYEGGESGPDSDIAAEAPEGVGAYVMGRKMFGGGDGTWDLGWKGWWKESPPFHVPVFVVTHHPRESLEMEGGTTFHFVTDGLDAALERALAAAGEKDVSIAGGASIVSQAIAAGRLDELYVHQVPLLLGSGAKLLNGLAGIDVEQADVVATEAVTHIRYRFPH